MRQVPSIGRSLMDEGVCRGIILHPQGNYLPTGGYMRKTQVVRRLCYTSILAALYLVLCILDFNVGRFKISLASIVLYFVSFCFPLPDCFAVSLLGVFLDQLLYGLTPTTFLWMLPPLIRPIIIAPISLALEKRGKPMEERKIISVILIIVSSICVSILNTGVYYLDSLIIGYTYKAVILDTIFQALISLAVSIVISFIIFPLIKSLRKSGLLPQRRKKDKIKKLDELI